MKKILSVIFAVTILILSLSFAGCIKTPEKDKVSAVYRGYYMNTLAQIVVYDDFSDQTNREAFEEFATEAKTAFFSIEKSISATLSSSCVSAFNEAEAGAKVELDKHAYNVMKIAYDMYELTDGSYNPAVYYSVRAYGFNGGSFPENKDDLPDDAEISKYIELSEHFAEVELLEENGNYYAVKPEYTVETDGEKLSLKLDLGGVGKGYAADVVNGLFDKYGFEKGYFNFGSSSLAFKKGSEGGDIVLQLTDPRNISSQYLQLNISDKCVSTSGDYENCYELEGQRYCHIFDPKTGKPIDTGIMTATVMGGSAAENDALTTAIMAMGAENAVNFINTKISDRLVVFTCDSGNGGYKYYTNMQADFNLLNKRYAPLAAEA